MLGSQHTDLLNAYMVLCNVDEEEAVKAMELGSDKSLVTTGRVGETYYALAQTPEGIVWREYFIEPEEEELTEVERWENEQESRSENRRDYAN